MRKFLLAILILAVLPSVTFGAALSKYFATGGSGTTCSEGSPCAFTYIQTVLNNYDDDTDTLTIKLNRGNTWNMSSSTVMNIDKSNVTVDAYGAGALPIIDGGLSYPSSTSSYAISIGDDSGASITGVYIKNIRIQNLYPGGGIIFAGTNNSDYFTGPGGVDGVEFYEIGHDAISIYGVPNSGGSATAIKIENCLVDTVGEYWRTIAAPYGWPNAISTAGSITYGHEIRHCVINNTYTEGIGAQGFAVVEYNNISGTKAPGIYFDSRASSYTTTTAIRYNLIWGDTNTSYTGSTSGIRIDDESSSGANTGRTIEIYGNVIAGGFYGGIDIRNRDGYSHWGSIKTYDNTVIDTQRNFIFSRYCEFNSVDIRNNISMINSDVASSSQHVVEWPGDCGTTRPAVETIGPNYWFGDGFTSETQLPTDWRDGTNVFGTSNPFSKTSGWRSLTTAPAMSNFTPSGTAVDNANTDNLGASYDDYVYTGEWTDLPATESLATADQDTAGSDWDFGAIIVYSGEPAAPTPDPMTWSSEPSADSTTAISMTGTTCADDTPPILYQFVVSAGTCGANYGAGGTSSGWQSADPTYTDSGLDVNKCYSYTAQAEDSDVPTLNTATSSVDVYTLAATPGAPTLGNADTDSIDLTANAENGNPAANPTTTFACQITGTSPEDTAWLTKWIQADGSPGASEAWLSDAAWDATIIVGTTTALNSNTFYTVQCKAKNGDAVETALGAEATIKTDYPPASGENESFSGGTFSGGTLSP